MIILTQCQNSVVKKTYCTLKKKNLATSNLSTWLKIIILVSEIILSSRKMKVLISAKCNNVLVSCFDILSMFGGA